MAIGSYSPFQSTLRPISMSEAVTYNSQHPSAVPHRLERFQCMKEKESRPLRSGLAPSSLVGNYGCCIQRTSEPSADAIQSVVWCTGHSCTHQLHVGFLRNPSLMVRYHVNQIRPSSSSTRIDGSPTLRHTIST